MWLQLIPEFIYQTTIHCDSPKCCGFVFSATQVWNAAFKPCVPVCFQPCQPPFYEKYVCTFCAAAGFFFL